MTFLVQKIKNKVSLQILRLSILSSMKILHGPKKFYLKDNEVALVIIGRNMEFFIDGCISHHMRLGVKCIVYVDNGSSDRSVEIASQRPDVIVVQTRADFKLHESIIRYHAVTAFAEGGWRLVVDLDELFDYPGRREMLLPELAELLSVRGYTALVAQMLDMFPLGSFPETHVQNYNEAIQRFNHYSIENISKFEYHSCEIDWNYFLKKNHISDIKIKIYFGGVRKALFGENCCLTKHPFFRLGPGVVPLPHPHVSTGVVCADFSAVLYHYKFAGGMLDREKVLLEEGRVAHGEALLRISALESRPDISFLQVSSKSFPTVESLIESGFLVAGSSAG